MGILGLRLFLFGIMDLIKNGEKESVKYVEDHLSTGIASVLFQKYENTFAQVGFRVDHLDSVNNYYKDNWNGTADGLEYKYICQNEDGLYLLIKLALNEIF